jgi:hypothetical protein
MASPAIPTMNDMFAQLIAAYPTFDTLKPYLESIGVKANTKEGDPLVIFRYEREAAAAASGGVAMANPVVRAFRSVVWDSVKNLPVFVSPMKSQPIETFPTDFSNVVVEEFADGVMVNAFFDQYKNAWRIATRSRLDADNKFYKHTFAELFTATWQHMFPGTPLFSGLNPAWGYSFVLQHPLNRIVVPVAQPNLILVEVTAIAPNAQFVVLPTMPNVPMQPRRFAVTNPADCQLLLSNMEQFEGIRSQGIVVRNAVSGQRWKMRTNTYVACRKLRGNHSQQEYVWFDNVKNGTLDQYLMIYPEERAGAAVLAGAWTKVVSDIYNIYVKVFKTHEMQKEAIPGHLKGMLFDLHRHYVGTLVKEKRSLDWKEHQAMMAKQDLKRMVFLATFKEGSAPPPSFQKRQKFLEASKAKTAATAAEGMTA